MLFETSGSLTELVRQSYRDCAPCIVTLNDIDYTIYTKKGRFHRENGPAVSYKSYEVWFYEGECHCDTGPALSHFEPAGQGYHFWFFHGINVSDMVEAWLDAYKLLPKDPQSWTSQHKVYFKLTFAGAIEKRKW